MDRHRAKETIRRNGIGEGTFRIRSVNECIDMDCCMALACCVHVHPSIVQRYIFGLDHQSVHPSSPFPMLLTIVSHCTTNHPHTRTHTHILVQETHCNGQTIDFSWGSELRTYIIWIRIYIYKYIE